MWFRRFFASFSLSAIRCRSRQSSVVILTMANPRERPVTMNAEQRKALIDSYKQSGDCQLYELMQYQCEVGVANIECTPFVRLFLKCAGKPATEVTPEYDYGNDVTSVLPDFGSIDDRKTPPGVVMMDEDSSKDR
ncbi:uncharacterized protein BYT42DRAFT_556637 [Radiomyces spectabilis]|uniref:uncharacterized protein n=1 Tax=Radiomyces spectabilis TaxID=64574 RepID=UPI00221F7248|nr:uncharacterized protein BYT42DRAFT_556637 [Radiomyces spectabilis]KAI8391364.1 hypothetical protein BYT42DRAFT_556637 [Radiomyces spectabilis]